jgi:amino acid adenylation domain-containing protein
MIAEDREQGMEYWLKRLRSGGIGSGFPTDCRHPQPGDARAAESVIIPAICWAEFKTICKQEQLNAEDALVGLLQILLHRYTATETIEIGVQVDALFLVSTVVDPSATVRGNLARTVSVLPGAKKEACSWENFRRWSREAAHESNDAWFRVLLAIESTSAEENKEDETKAHCDLRLSVRETNKSDILMRADYRRELYKSVTIQNILLRFKFLVESFRDVLGQIVSQVTLCSTFERQQLARDVEAGYREFDGLRTVHERFEDQVRRSPDAIAVVLPGEHRQELTYAELNRRANRLAHYLQSRGVRPDVLVGLYLDRTPDLIVAMLAIVKAGGAYLPIDLSYPPERVAFMLSDAESPIVITDSKTAKGLPQTAASALCMDTDAAYWSTMSAENPVSGAGPDNLAYCIFTSGSTGKPKGVLITHRNVARLFDATDEWFHFNDQDRWTFFHSSAFDFSVWEIWGALTYGGRLVIVPFADSRSPERFYDVLAGERVTVLNQTPSAFRQLVGVDEGRQNRKLEHLRFVIFGGEALNLQSLAVWFDKYGDDKPQLVNMYGITETTVHVTYRPLKRSDLVESPGSVIGRSIPDLTLHILDGNLRPVPVGIPGEIFVGGAGVARGYLKREALTAEKFVPNPFSATSGKLYRSGDLARRLPGGDLEYMGRLDHQVKIRGFRIELGEVQAALTRQPSVREAFVLAKECDGDKALVAYVVPASGEAPAVDTLRKALQTALPAYMVPAHFVFLTKLPLTQNGKIDRAALPAPSAERARMEQAFNAPSTATERGIARIYQQILNVDKIGIDDDFFDLGGNSLTLAQAHSHLTKLVGRNFSVAELFVHTTVRKLAASLDQSAPQKLPQQELLSRAQRQRQAIRAGNWRR